MNLDYNDIEYLAFYGRIHEHKWRIFNLNVSEQFIDTHFVDGMNALTNKFVRE